MIRARKLALGFGSLSLAVLACRSFYVVADDAGGHIMPDGGDAAARADAGSSEEASNDAVVSSSDTLVADAPADCTGQHLYYGGVPTRCHRFAGQLGWLAAESDCVTWGGYLVTIGGQPEETFVSTIINTEATALQPDAGFLAVWIGLERVDGGALEWTDGTPGPPSGFENWGSNGPSGMDCGIQYSQLFENHWAMFGCGASRYYICVRP